MRPVAERPVRRNPTPTQHRPERAYRRTVQHFNSQIPPHDQRSQCPRDHIGDRIRPFLSTIQPPILQRTRRALLHCRGQLVRRGRVHLNPPLPLTVEHRRQRLHAPLAVDTATLIPSLPHIIALPAYCRTSESITQTPPESLTPPLHNLAARPAARRETLLRGGRPIDPRRFYLGYRGLSNFLNAVSASTYGLYVVREAGLDPLLVLVGTVLELSAFPFEVPIGVIADVPGFLFVALGQVILGLGLTFRSGALEAWLADGIDEERVAGTYLR